MAFEWSESIEGSRFWNNCDQDSIITPSIPDKMFISNLLIYLFKLQVYNLKQQ